jgi:hypothetical protein
LSITFKSLGKCRLGKEVVKLSLFLISAGRWFAVDPIKGISSLKGSIVRGLPFKVLDGKGSESFESKVRRIKSIAYCERCGCRLSQYRDPTEKLCKVCQRALNPLFQQTA